MMHLLTHVIIFEYWVQVTMQGRGAGTADISWQRMRQVAVNLGCCAKWGSEGEMKVERAIKTERGREGA